MTKEIELIKSKKKSAEAQRTINIGKIENLKEQLTGTVSLTHTGSQIGGLIEQVRLNKQYQNLVSQREILRISVNDKITVLDDAIIKPLGLSDIGNLSFIGDIQE